MLLSIIVNKRKRDFKAKHTPNASFSKGEISIGAFGKHRQLQDVASRYGILPQRASQIVKAAFGKLHKALAA